MANPTVSNIVKSGAKLFFAPVGTADPDETTVLAGGAWGSGGSAGWQPMGYTKSALTFAYEDEQLDLEVEEELAPVRRIRIKENLTLETTLAEFTAEMLQLAMGDQADITTTVAATTQRAFEETSIGGVTVIPPYRWGIEGIYINDQGADFPIRIFVHKGTAKINGALEFSQKTDDYIGIPIQIKAMADTTKTAGNKLCTIQRVTAEKTA